MTGPAAAVPGGAPYPGRARRSPGRAGVDDAALRLFAEYGVAGTSLQMIADALGVAKSAVHYHYRSKDDIVLGVLAPLLDGFPGLLERARSERGRVARAESVLVGLVDLAFDNVHRFGIVLEDPGAIRVLADQDWLRGWHEGVVELLVGPGADAGRRVAASMLLGGLAGPLRDESLPPLSRAELRALTLENARRLLRLPQPKADAAGPE